MVKLEKIRLDFTAHRKQVLKFWWLILLIASAWFYFAAVIIGKNWYGVYNPGLLLWGFLGIPLIFIGFTVVAVGLILPNLGRAHRKERIFLFGLSLVIAALLAWLFPPPMPAFSQPHTLRLVPTGTLNPASKGAEIEIEGLRAIDGSSIPLDRLALSGDWRLAGGKLVSHDEQPASVAVLSGPIPGGVELRMEFHRKAGRLLVQLDDHSQEIDLYSPWNTKGNVVIFPSPWAGYSFIHRGFVILGAFLYFLALAALVFMVGLVFQLRLLPSWVELALLASFYLVVLVFFVGHKRSYANFSAERVYGDTITYARTAEVPLSSFRFWFSDRTFTLPLLYKLSGMNTGNYTDREVMRRVADSQTWLSIVGWTALALAAAATMRKRWLGPVAFALVLFFSLSIDISIWDRLMYSEAVSFSLFALLLAMWFGLELLPAKWRTSLIRGLYLFGMVLVTVLYSFTRDTNLYFLLVAGVIFTLAAVFKRTAPENKRVYLVYALAILGLFFFQNMTMRLGSRWQIHIFDHIVRRILVDEQALDYFQAAGLPTSQKLFALTEMGVGEYQGLLERSDIPEYKAVRDWVNQSGQSTYIRYLLEHPEKSLLQPVQNFGNLINGNNLEYRFPVFPNQPIADFIETNDQKFYLRSLASFFGLIVLLAMGIWMHWSGRDRRHPAWIVLAVLVISIPPLAFMVWNGNPLEIERHAAQIGLQFRLAGWIGLMLLFDELALSYLNTRLRNGSSPLSTTTKPSV